MEDQIIGVICSLALFIFIGWVSFKSQRRYGENPPDAKYTKGRR